MSEWAIRLAETGGADRLRYEQVELPMPGEGDVAVRHTAIGVNFIDVYYRIGLYPAPLPSGIGVEGVGVVEAVGAGVSGVRVGDRVSYCVAPLGSYATARVYPAAQLVRIPDGVSDEQAAAVTLKGLTAWYLLRRVRRLQAGETILVHAAAGGVGTILTQWAHHIGARVIGTAGSEEKAQLARANGADDVILYRSEDVAGRVRELTGGAGVPVVYDSVGKDTFETSLDSLARFGLMVSFGNASGAAPAVAPLTLMSKGSLFLTRPLLGHYIAERSELEAGAAELFGLVADGVLRPVIGQRLPLAEAAEAHRRLESRVTTGATVLIP
jgi:NADPH2:quinone reductase